MIAIGIDPGVNTGFAIWSGDRFKLDRVSCMSMLEAMDEVKLFVESARECQQEFIVIVEDARKRKIFDKADREEEGYKQGSRREGVGSVKRDCKLWEEFLIKIGIPYEMRMPRATKMKAEPFERLTGWSQKTNKHSRDAAMIVFQLNNTMLRLKIQTFKEQREPGRESSLPAGARLRTSRRRR